MPEERLARARATLPEGYQYPTPVEEPLDLVALIEGELGQVVYERASEEFFGERTIMQYIRDKQAKR